MIEAGSAAPRRHAPGFALIVVLWFLALLAAVASYILANARAEVGLAHNILAAARAEALADSGIAQAAFDLSDPVGEETWRLDGAPHRVALPGGEVIIRLRDENEKINPNLASEKLMAALFTVLGSDDARARRLAAATADWVSPGDQPRPLGAKKPQYLDAGLTYGPANAPLSALDDLRFVLGMTPKIFANARPYLTIFTQVQRPDGNGAADPVKRALALATEAAPNAITAANVAGAIPATATSFGNAVVAEVEVTARGTDGGVFVRSAVIRIDPANPKGYAVLDWRRLDFAP